MARNIRRDGPRARTCLTAYGGSPPGPPEVGQAPLEEVRDLGRRGETAAGSLACNRSTIAESQSGISGLTVRIGGWLVVADEPERAGVESARNGGRPAAIA